MLNYQDGFKRQCTLKKQRCFLDMHSAQTTLHASSMPKTCITWRLHMSEASVQRNFEAQALIKRCDHTSSELLSAQRENTSVFSQTLEGKIVKAHLFQLQIKMLYIATDMQGCLFVLETFPANPSVPPRIDALAGMKSTWTTSTLEDMRSLRVCHVQSL